ncbi:hypothetical protein [Ornithinimicrobium avium]|uniref:PNPLA domain-containing protein n=1 Tax=Ornithinimicrobium avium TaxID=2283195 RepID=A0A345NK78_9MICO|nr:hypothetical protein [Ornithinimicrobium avium]AXH95436.1 hypothetical protein DV701_04200 [Ornithinimicrobium avium]
MISLGRWAWPFLLVCALAAQSVLGRVDGALRARHDVGAVSGGLGDIASPAAVVEPGMVDAVVSGWSDDVDVLLWTYLAFDLVLMTMVALLVLRLRSAVARLLQQDHARPAVDPATAQLPADEASAAAVSVGAVAALRWSVLAVVGYLFADLAETVIAVRLGLESSAPGWAAVMLGTSSILKWVLLVFAVVPVLLAGAGLRDLRKPALAGLRAVRGLVLVAAALVAVFLMLTGDIGRQIDDVAGHAAQSPTRAALATLLAVATSGVMVVGGRRCVTAYRSRPDVRPMSARYLLTAGGAGLALVVVGLVVGLSGPERYRPTALALLLLPGAGLLGWSLLSWPQGVRDLKMTDSPDPVEPSTSPVWVLASAPPLLLLLVVVRAATTVWAVGEAPPSGLLIWSGVMGVIVAIVLIAVIVASVRVVVDARLPGRAPAHETLPSEGLWWIGASLVLLAVAALGTTATGWMWLGSVAVVFLFALIGSVGLVGLTLLGDAIAPRGALAVAGLRRMPLMTLLVLWGVVASLVDTKGFYYDVALVDRPAAAQNDHHTTASSVGRALDVWLGPPGSGPAEQDRSLVFVTASGGGIRAAYWTQLVWECAFGTRCGEADVRAQDRSEQVFMASGVSGGAVGLALVVAGKTLPDGRSDLLGKDFLAPALAAALARDLPNSVLRLPVDGYDRAATLADAVASVDAGLTMPLSSYDGAPQLALSGTSVEDGCRFTLSTVMQARSRNHCSGLVAEIPTSGPGAAPVRDGLTYLCDRSRVGGDIRLVDAAFLSARFPYVSPAASLHRCHGDEETYVLDGGMYDNSGGSSVTNVLAALAPYLDRRNGRVDTRRADAEVGCVIPRMLVIENQFASSARPDAVARPLQSVGPARALLSFYDDRSDRELARAVDAVTTAAQRAHRLCYPGASELKAEDVVVVVHPVAAGGVAAPLGWTLAETTRKRMAQQVQVDCAEVDAPTQGIAPGPDDAGLEEHRRETCAALRTVDGWWGDPP